MNGILQTIISNLMRNKNRNKKAEDKKPAPKPLTEDQVQALEKELNTLELQIIRHINDQDTREQLEADKLEILKKLNRE